MSDAEDKPKTGDRETKEPKDKSKEDGHLDNEVPIKNEDGKDDGKSKDKMTPSKKNAKPKIQKKEEKNEVKEEEDEDDEDEDDDDDEDDDGENETNGKVPLLDQPLQISGTRDRKKVQRFSEEFKTVIRESPKNEIPEGRGVPLGEIPRIESLIQKHTSEILKPLYKALFNRPGKLSMVKRNIRKFNGFDFKEGSDEYSKKRANLAKLDLKSLKSICSTLDLSSSGKREDIVSNILDFLMEPKDSKKPPIKDSKRKKKEARTSSSKKTKRKSSSAKNKKKPQSDDEDESSDDEMDVDEKESSDDEKKPPAEKKKKSSDEKKESDDEKKESDDEKKESDDEKKESDDEKMESSDEEDEDSDDKNKKKKAPKKKPAANAKKPAPKKVEKKVEAAKKADTKTTEKKKRKEKESESKSDNESSEDEPLVKKTKMPPTDEEIKCFVKQILEGANLEEITMKTVCKQVYAAYPEFDLAHKKDFIKTTVKSLIST